MKHHIFLLFCLAVASTFVGCKKDSDSDTQSKADFYFLAKVDGTDIAIEYLATNQVELSTSNGGSQNPPDCTYSYGASIGTEFVVDGPSATIDFQYLFDGDCSEESAQFNDLFVVGVYDFNVPKGVVIRYSDETGDYSSENGVQTDAQFQITKSEATNDAFGLAQTVSGTFQCTVFDDMGAKKELNNGVFKLHFRTY